MSPQEATKRPRLGGAQKSPQGGLATTMQSHRRAALQHCHAASPSAVVDTRGSATRIHRGVLLDVLGVLLRGAWNDHRISSFSSSASEFPFFLHD